MKKKNATLHTIRWALKGLNIPFINTSSVAYDLAALLEIFVKDPSHAISRIVREMAEPPAKPDRTDWLVRANDADAGFIIEAGVCTGIALGDDEITLKGGEFLKAYGDMVAKAIWPALQPTPELAADAPKRYASHCGRTAKAFGLPFEVVLALGPDPAVAAIWRQAREISDSITLEEIYDLNAGIDRRRDGIKAVFEKSNPDWTWEEFNAQLPCPVIAMGQRYSKALANDLLKQVETDLHHHGVHLRP